MTLADPQLHLASPSKLSLRLVVVWIDWYAYHVARFEGLLSNPDLRGRVAGIELVGGIGVHAGLKFRETLPADLPIQTLCPEASWQQAGKANLSWRVWQQLSRFDPAAVLVPGYYTLPAIAAALWAKTHDRTSILMTESTAFDHARIPWKEALKSLLLRSLFDGAVAGGKAHLRYLEELHFPMDRVARAYDVVDNTAIAASVLDLRRQPRESMGVPSTPYFLYVGRLAPEKNIENLLAAWFDYRQAGGTWPLVLVGDGPSAPALLGQAAASPFRADVLFAGLHTSRELPRFYAFAGCFVLPSLREPWGLVVNEAMAAALPVLVSSRCGCAEDLVKEGSNGFIFDPSSISELTDRLQEMARMSSDELKGMGRTSERIISAYSPQRFGQEIASLLLKQEGDVLDPASS